MIKPACRSCKTRPQAAAKRSRHQHRLPHTVVPQSYRILLATDLSDPVFRGEVEIDVDVRRARRTITINAKGLQFGNVRIANGSGISHRGTVKLNAERETARISFGKQVAAGRWTLFLEYAGKLREDGAGLFLSAWKDDPHDEKSPEHRIIASQFESADARCAFPCFDQPDMKATFSVKMVVDRKLKALSNGDVVSIKHYEGKFGNGKKVVEFAQTIRMSTYLVAFVLGDLEHTQPLDVEGTRVCIWTVRGDIDKTETAMEATCFGLRYLENYFDSRYPGGNKLDLVDVPGFGWGGMENVGLIIFPRGTLAEDKSRRRRRDNFGTHLVIMHELAHQWFGNLVTMEWWDDLWLNESFATFMSFKAMAAWKPKLRSWDKFAGSRESAFNLDALRNSHAIQQEVDNPHHDHMVNAISYEKGAAVLLMLENYMGPVAFRQGIRRYLTSFAFGNAVGDDLWNSLASACHGRCDGLAVGDIMRSWVQTVGFPQVSVCGDPASGRITITQARFALTRSPTDNQTRWPIPVVLEYATQAGQRRSVQLLLDEQRQTLVIGRNFQWVKLNAGGRGFYRSLYSPRLLDLLIEHSDSLSVIERHNLVSDTAAAVQARRTPISSKIKLLFSRLNEDSPVVWRAVSSGFEQLESWVPDNARHHLRLQMVAALKQSAQALGWSAQGKAAPFTAGWYPYHLNLNPLVQEASLKVLEQWQQDPKALPAGIAGIAAMVLQFTKTSVPEEFKQLDKPTGELPTGQQLQDYLLALSRLAAADSPHSDPFYLIAAVVLEERAERPGPIDDFIKDWPKWIEEMRPYSVIFKVKNLGQYDDPSVEKRLTELFARHPYPQASQAIAQTLEHIRCNVLARRAHSKRLAIWFSSPGSSIAA